jgi:hypothetical protein
MQFLHLSVDEGMAKGLSFQECSGDSSGSADSVAGSHVWWLPEMF